MILKMKDLEICFRLAESMEVNFVGVLVKMSGFEQPEVIINPNKNFAEKLAYYQKAYGDDLVLKSFSGIKIVGFCSGDDFNDIQRELIGMKDYFW